MNRSTESITMVFAAFFAALVQGCINNLMPILIAITVFAFITIADFITGVSASKVEGKGFESGRLRKCFNKWLVYLSVFVATAVLGVLLTLLAQITKGSIENTQGFFLNILRWEVWIAVAIELLSIVENLHRILPNNVYISVIYYVFSLQIKNKFPEIQAAINAKKNNNSIDQKQ